MASPRTAKVQVKGHAQVSVRGLRTLSKKLKAAGATVGPGGGSSGSAAGDLGKRLLMAGELVAALAREKAGWSEQIPPKIKVRGGRTGVRVQCNAGPAYPNEIEGVRHPVFGNREIWVTNEFRPFLGPAADEGAEAAAELVADVIDDWAAEHGFS